jgi:multidrug efflux system outer membrane protein
VSDRRSRRAAALTALAFALALAACTTPPRRDPPRPVRDVVQDLPDRWQQAGEPALLAGKWWSVYGDPALDRLVDEALAANLDLVRAVARVDQARAILAITRAAQYPTATLDASKTQQQVSAVNAFPLPPGVPRIQPANRIGIEVAYEIDFWGRFARATDAARADLFALEEDREAVRLALTADVVKSYFTLAAADRSIESTERTVASRAETLRLQRERLRYGLASEYEVRTFETELASARSTLAAVNRDRALAQNALAVLLGRTPKRIVEAPVDRNVPAEDALPPQLVPAGLPSDLLLRRPDLRATERRLQAADARIDVARAAMFPSIQLTGRLGTEAASLSDLFSGPAGVWRLGGSLLQPVFSAGRLRAEVERGEAFERELVAQYRQTVQGAFREVLDAIQAQASAREVLEAETARERSLSETLAMAEVRYKSGLSSQLEVLDAQRGLLGARLAKIDAARQWRLAVADLARALGGGWEERTNR